MDQRTMDRIAPFVLGAMVAVAAIMFWTSLPTSKPTEAAKTEVEKVDLPDIRVKPDGGIEAADAEEARAAYVAERLHNATPDEKAEIRRVVSEKLAQKYHLDGVVVDWPWPTQLIELRPVWAELSDEKKNQWAGNIAGQLVDRRDLIALFILVGADPAKVEARKLPWHAVRTALDSADWAETDMAIQVLEAGLAGLPEAEVEAGKISFGRSFVDSFRAAATQWPEPITTTDAVGLYRDSMAGMASTRAARWKVTMEQTMAARKFALEQVGARPMPPTSLPPK